jgi:hypothetical protein
VGAVLPVSWGGAQQAPRPAAPRPAPVASPTRRDTLPAGRPNTPSRADTLRRPGAGDTVRVTRDSVTVAAPARADTGTARVRGDSIRGIPDSLARRRAPRDSVKAPFARAELPVLRQVGPAYRWVRDSSDVAGALTLADLVERIPGVTTYRSSWLAGVQNADYLGDFRRIRVFRDGVEQDPIDPRSGGVQDLVDVQLWALDEVVLEPTATELRVHLRTWTVRNVTPATRVDAYTGDEDTNLYRGFYGKRFGNGLGLQVALQQFGTGARNQRLGGGGGATAGQLRLGWARGLWTADAFVTRLDRTRDPTLGLLTRDEVLGRQRGRRDEGYLRLGWGDPERRGPWVQALASATDYTLVGTSVRQTTPATEERPAETLVLPDSSRARTQYVLAGGWTLGPLRLSATNRTRVEEVATWHAPSVRASADFRWLSVGAFAERLGSDSTDRVEVDGRLTPFRWLALAGAAGIATQQYPGEAPEERLSWRGELAVRLGGLWLGGGRLFRGEGLLQPPRVYTRTATATSAPRPLTVVIDPAASGSFGSARGRLFRAVHADVSGIFWDKAGVYRPQYQGRAELRVSTNLLRRFPSGNFGLQVAAIDEYRSRILFPTIDATSAQLRLIEAPPANVLNFHLEIRIQSASVTYQLRNALNREYEQVPGITLPRLINYYGVRWHFAN